jgi:hypothetical protein
MVNIADHQTRPIPRTTRKAIPDKELGHGQTENRIQCGEAGSVSSLGRLSIHLILRIPAAFS